MEEPYRASVLALPVGKQAALEGASDFRSAQPERWILGSRSKGDSSLASHG